MLEKLRTSKGITCTFVAKQLKIDRGTLRRIEKGKALLPSEFIPFLSKLYGVSYKEIIDGRARSEKNNKRLSK